MSKIILIQLWIGEIPHYFWYHYETTKNLNIDFLFITDQDIKISSKNYKVIKITKDKLIDILKSKINIDIELINKKNITILKPSLGYLFSEYLDGYDFFGYYDIDVLFGDVRKYINGYVEDYEIISFGNEKFHNRISGPFTIIKNTKKNRELFLKEKNTFIEKFKTYNVKSFDEHEFNKLSKENCKVKILFDVDNQYKLNGKYIYDCEWSAGKLSIENFEKMIYHFYDKKNTKLEIIGNTIKTSHKKHLLNDFYWITYLTKNYEPLLNGLITSIKKYSSRKCIIYTINYDSHLRFLLTDQFIFRRIDLENVDLNEKGRDNTVLSSKPKILSDSIDYINNGKFVYIDTDIYLTNVCDNIGKFFEELDNYPLINKHIHDVLYKLDNGEWISPLHILAESTNIEINIFPRRKCNVIIYDKNSQWFFIEQMKIYQKYKNTKRNIFALHDEDSANILLNKYNFSKSLPLLDMEESDSIDMEKFFNYSYHMTQISQNVTLPKTINDIYMFHGFKDVEFYKQIESNYGKTVLNVEDFIITYENNTIIFTKNNFFTDKVIENNVCFKLYDINRNLIFNLINQKIYNYWVFFISNIYLTGELIIEVEETSSKRIIYKNLLKL